MNKSLKIDPNSKLEWLGTEGALLEEHDYLFITKKGEEPFIQIQKSLHELNDFCVMLIRSVKSTGVEEQSNYDALLSSAFEDGMYTDEGFDKHFSLSVLAYSCEDFGRIFAPASAVLLLYGTLIRSLYAVAQYYGEQKCKQYDLTKEKAGAELPPLRQLLESICGKKIEVFDNRQVDALIFNQARYLRNKFIHGDWNAVDKALAGVNVRNCFAAVSFIFYELELLFDEDQTPSGRVKTLSFDDDGKWFTE